MPFVGAALASHDVLLQVASVSLPLLQLDSPDTMYPLLHAGAQVAPDARVEVQVPTLPFVGAALASQVAA